MHTTQPLKSQYYSSPTTPHPKQSTATAISPQNEKMSKPADRPSRALLYIQALTTLIHFGILIVLSLVFITLKQITLKTSPKQSALQIYWGGGNVDTYVRGMPN